jgi:hypothetical protein
MNEIESPNWTVLYCKLRENTWNVFDAGENEDEIKQQFKNALEQKEDGAIGEVRLIEPEYIYSDADCI